MIEDVPGVASALRRDFGEPDERLHCFDLAKEGPVADELVAAPMLQEPGGLGRDLPATGIGNQAPGVHPLPQTGNDGHRVVLLCLTGQALAFVEDHPALSRALARSGDRRDEFGGPAALADAVGRLPFLVELPVTSRALVRRIQNRLTEEVAHHSHLNRSEPGHNIAADEHGDGPGAASTGWAVRPAPGAGATWAAAWRWPGTLRCPRRPGRRPDRSGRACALARCARSRAPAPAGTATL